MKTRQTLRANMGQLRDKSVSIKTAISRQAASRIALLTMLGCVFVFCALGCTSSSLHEEPSTDAPDKPTTPCAPSKPVEYPAEPAPTSDVITTDQADAFADFSVRLFDATYDDNNTLVSPLSVAYALGLIEPAAQGQTLSQIEDATGMTSEEMNDALRALLASLEQQALTAADDDSRDLYIANALWVDDGLPVKQDYLATTASQFNAEIFTGTLGKRTVAEINSWINSHTNGMVPGVLDELTPLTSLVLVNATSFDAQWGLAYEDDDLVEDIFTNANGQTQKVTFMESEEDCYVELSNASGFIKYYKGASFAFVGLLPAEGSTPRDVVESLSGETLRKAIGYSRSADVLVRLPRFSDECRTELVEPLKELGITDAFELNADFWSVLEDAPYERDGVALPVESFYLSSATQNAVIEVDEAGTRAAAATVITADAATAAPDIPREKYEVYLDRPFVYMIVHVPTNLPVFIGTVDNIDV
ncbi:serpin family protein [Eggerthellaceae bacterium 3-80]|nr:serpin family protein [bacterium D16-34]